MYQFCKICGFIKKWRAVIKDETVNLKESKSFLKLEVDIARKYKFQQISPLEANKEHLQYFCVICLMDLKLKLTVDPNATNNC